MKKSVGKLLLLSSLTILSLCSYDPNSKKQTGNTKIYLYTIRNNNAFALDSGLTVNLYFYDVPNLPYICIDDYFNTFVPSTFSITNSNNVFTFTNKIWKDRKYTSDNINYNSYDATATFDASTNVITYGDYACFTNVDSYSLNPVDVVCGEGIFEDEEEQIPMFKSRTKENIYFPGDTKSIDLDEYNIVPKVINNKLYLPLYTAKTLFTSNTYSYFYNGKALYIDLPNLGYNYNYTVANGMFTPTTSYLEYAYYQLALELDIRFGLKNFTRFDRYTSKSKTYASSGYDILGDIDNYISSAANFDKQLMNVYATKMDDGGHTGCTGYSYYYTKSPKSGDESSWIYDSYKKIEKDRGNIDEEGYAYSMSALYANDEKTQVALRLDGFNTYENEGNAFEKIINFIELLNKKTVTHAIIDLSCNGGGYVFMQYLFTYYLTGGKTTNYVKNTFNGSYGYVNYDVDSNVNGIIGDDGDKIPSEVTTVDILTSNATFSAANATACYLNSSGDSKFKFYGEKTGGGCCCVDGDMIDALGMSAQRSSPLMLTYSDYGNDFDDGLTPSKANQLSSHTEPEKFEEYYEDLIPS